MRSKLWAQPAPDHSGLLQKRIFIGGLIYIICLLLTVLVSGNYSGDPLTDNCWLAVSRNESISDVDLRYQCPSLLCIPGRRNHHSLLWWKLICQITILNSDGWRISQHNARVIISDPHDRAVGLDAAHYQMLCSLCHQAAVPSELFLAAVLSSCLAQQRADLEYHVPWFAHMSS